MKWTGSLTKFIFHGISFLVFLLPMRVRWWWACVLAWLWWDVLRLRRFTVYRNLTIVFPEKSKEERRQLARVSLRHMCMALPEFFSLPMLSRDFVARNMVIEGREHYDKAAAQGKGVLLLSLHIGNGDMGVTIMSLSGFPSHLISKKFKNQFLNSLWFGVREDKGVRFIDPHGTKTAFEILAACRRGEAVVFVLDQFMGRPFGIPTTFFGRPTGTAYGLSLFASKTGAPVVPVYTYRDEKLRTHLRFEPEIPFEENANRDLQNQIMTQKYNTVIENLIRRHPDQWMWVHRRWKRYE